MQRAESLRGSIELHPGTPERQRWPRTTGADVITIAAVIDPHVRLLPRGFGTLALQRRWHACMDDIERLALGTLGETYPENRALWSCLAAVFAHLASVDAPLPDPAMWSVLIAELGFALAVTVRNIGPKGDSPIKQFDGVKTYHELYLKLYNYLRELRGADRMKPEADMLGSERPIPRTTNADVIALADYWTKQLGKVKKVYGHDDIVARWKAALVDVDQLARKGDPNAVYAKNNGFWRTLAMTARQISVADEAPDKWDIILESFKHSITHLPENLKAGAKAIASGAAEVAGSVAEGAGRVVNQAAKGVFGGFGVPFLVGGGLLGLFLISRAKSSKTERQP
ncbi:MAG TPA: hypothetical protein VNO30_21090 [Kofleriaceae bacterium]|nr:hypothetical protein [Kofleriaceae bacterium]